MEDLRVTELYAAVIDWAASTGAEDISKQPGLWYGKTKKIGKLGPFDVRINPHAEEIDAVPPLWIKISMDDYFPGLVALIGPTDGAVLCSPYPEQNEAGLIQHFKKNAESAAVMQ